MLFADGGLPAGDVFNDIAIKIHAVQEFDQLLVRQPNIDFLSYIDDSAFGISSSDREFTKRMAIAAGRDFKR